MTASNPWFWGELSRWQFEREIEKTAVLLHNGKGMRPVKVEPPKVDIEAVKARKNAMAAMLKAGSGAKR